MDRKTVYVSFDGKDFDDEKECDRYESARLEELKMDFMWDKDFKITREADKAMCFYVKNATAREWLARSMKIFLTVGDFACRLDGGLISSIEGVKYYLDADERDAEKCRNSLRLLNIAKAKCMKKDYVEPVDCTVSKNLLEEWGRMCRSMKDCADCMLYSMCDDFSPRFLYTKNPVESYFTDDIISVVSDWSRDNPCRS